MNFAYFLKGILLGLLVTIPLGPVGVLCIQRSLGKSRLSGMVSGLGASVADTLYAAIAALGVSFVVQWVKDMQTGLQIAGALIFYFVGYRVFNTNPAIQVRRQRNLGSRPVRDFLSAFLLTLSNPAVIFVFIASFAGFVVGRATTVWQVWLTVLGVFAGSALWWYGLVSAVSYFRGRIRLRSLLWVNKITGVLIFLFGTSLLVHLFFSSH